MRISFTIQIRIKISIRPDQAVDSDGTQIRIRIWIRQDQKVTESGSTMLQQGKVKQNTVRNSKLSYKSTVPVCKLDGQKSMVKIKNLIQLNIYVFLLMIKLTTHLLVRSRHWAVQHKWQLRPCCLTSRPSLLAFNSLALAILQRRTRMYGVMVRLKPTIYLRFFVWM